MGEEKAGFSKELDQKVKEHQAVLLKYPKNIRQVGEVGGGQRIYVEDYVMTYTMYLSSRAKDAYQSAVLLGKKAVVEGRRTLFISGAVKIPQQWQQNLSMTGDQWTAVYDQIQQYFQDVEIVGWFLTRPGMELSVSEQVHSVWRSSFDGTDKVLFLYDNISREDAFFICREGEFQRQEGYYIYYEKNEEMQNYIIDEKGGKSTDAGYQDQTSKKIRKKIEEKNKANIKYIHHQQFAYSAGILASAVVLVAATTKLYQSTSENTAADFTKDAQAVFKNDSWVLSDHEKEAETEGKTEGEEGEEETGEKGETEQEKDKEKDNQKNQESQENQNDQDDQNNQENQDSQENQEKTEQDQEQEQALGKKQETAGTSNSVKNSKKKNSQKKKKRYTVKKGDTLESISIACYGTSKYIKKIKRLNKLENADRIYIGQELILP